MTSPTATVKRRELRRLLVALDEGALDLRLLGQSRGRHEQKGVQQLAEAVMLMDAWISEVTKSVQNDTPAIDAEAAWHEWRTANPNSSMYEAFLYAASLRSESVKPDTAKVPEDDEIEALFRKRDMLENPLSADEVDEEIDRLLRKQFAARRAVHSPSGVEVASSFKNEHKHD